MKKIQLISIMMIFLVLGGSVESAAQGASAGAASPEQARELGIIGSAINSIVSFFGGTAVEVIEGAARGAAEAVIPTVNRAGSAAASGARYVYASGTRAVDYTYLQTKNKANDAWTAIRQAMPDLPDVSTSAQREQAARDAIAQLQGPPAPGATTTQTAIRNVRLAALQSYIRYTETAAWDEHLQSVTNSKNTYTSGKTTITSVDWQSGNRYARVYHDTEGNAIFTAYYNVNPNIAGAVPTSTQGELPAGFTLSNSGQPVSTALMHVPLPPEPLRFKQGDTVQYPGIPDARIAGTTVENGMIYYTLKAIDGRSEGSVLANELDAKGVLSTTTTSRPPASIGGSSQPAPATPKFGVYFGDTLIKGDFNNQGDADRYISELRGLTGLNSRIVGSSVPAATTSTETIPSGIIQEKITDAGTFIVDTKNNVIGFVPKGTDERSTAAAAEQVKKIIADARQKQEKAAATRQDMGGALSNARQSDYTDENGYHYYVTGTGKDTKYFKYDSARGSFQLENTPTITETKKIGGQDTKVTYGLDKSNGKINVPSKITFGSGDSASTWTAAGSLTSSERKNVLKWLERNMPKGGELKSETAKGIEYISIYGGGPSNLRLLGDLKADGTYYKYTPLDPNDMNSDLVQEIYDKDGKFLGYETTDSIGKWKEDTDKSQEKINQMNNARKWQNLETALTAMRGLGYYSRLFMDDEKMAKWKENVDKLFNNAILGGPAYWVSQICQNSYDLEKDGYRYYVTPDGLATLQGTINAERSTPIELPGEPAEYYYTVTYYVVAPQDKEVAFNIRITGDSNLNLYENNIKLNKGQQKREQIVRYSKNKYSKICITGLEDGEICNNIVESDYARNRDVNSPSSTGDSSGAATPEDDEYARSQAQPVRTF